MAEEDPPSQLNLLASVLLAAGALGGLVASTCFLADQVHRDECEDESLVQATDALWRVVFFYASVCLSALACGGYLYVGRKAARPWELHRYGLVLLLMLPGYVMQLIHNYLWCIGMYRARFALIFLSYANGALRYLIIVQLIRRKLNALGSPTGGSSGWRRLAHSTPWFRTLTVCVLVNLFARLAPYYIWAMVRIEQWKAVQKEGRGALAGMERALLLCLTVLQALLIPLLVISSVGALLTVGLVIKALLRKLADRETPTELLTELHRVLTRHHRGAMATVVSKVMVVCSLLLQRRAESALGSSGFFASLNSTWVSWAYLIDCIGDIVGIFLLSGLGELLVREDDEKGDITRLFRSMLHSAVIASRVNRVFEGRIIATRSRRCVVSFPGSYMSEWNSLTWLCELGELSSACVFLPTSDPQSRYGKHSQNPDDGNRCWCHKLYGGQQPWGCRWFEAWKSNVEEAVRLQLDLVVYFLGEAGQGEVDWDDLGTVDLWDGVGLGGSQKGEVAWLRKNGIPFVGEDMDTFRRRTSPA